MKKLPIIRHIRAFALFTILEVHRIINRQFFIHPDDEAEVIAIWEGKE